MTYFTAGTLINHKIKVCSDKMKVWGVFLFFFSFCNQFEYEIFSCCAVKNETKSSLKFLNLFHFICVGRSTQMRV